MRRPRQISSVTIERRTSLLWSRIGLWNRDRLRLSILRVTVRRVVCRSSDGHRLAIFDRASGDGLRAAEGNPGLWSARDPVTGRAIRGVTGPSRADDMSDWRLHPRDRARFYAPAPDRDDSDDEVTE